MKRVLDVKAYVRGKIVEHTICQSSSSTSKSLYIVQIYVDVYMTLYFNSRGYQVDELIEPMSEPTYLLLLWDSTYPTGWVDLNKEHYEILVLQTKPISLVSLCNPLYKWYLDSP